MKRIILKKIILIVFTGGNTRIITALTDFYRFHDQLSTFIHSCVVSLSKPYLLRFLLRGVGAVHRLGLFLLFKLFER